MSSAGEIILNIVVFLFSLTLLVVIHEFGHFIVSKAFNVYVGEFSIGMGPAIFSRKKEGRETMFSIRCLPLGGYCAIADKGPEMTPEEEEKLSDKEKESLALYKSLPKERRLDGIAKWKKFLIMIAGVTLNFVLGWLLLVLVYATVDVPTKHANYLGDVTSDSIAYNAGWTTDDIIDTIKYTVTIGDEVTSKEAKCGDVDTEDNLIYTIEEAYSSKYTPTSYADNIVFNLVTTEGKNIDFTINAVENDNGTFTWGKIGITFAYDNVNGITHYNFGEVMVNSFKQFGNYSILIFKAIGSLFTIEGISQVGSIVAVFTVQEQVMKMGFSYVVNLWALISINLGIMNLLPFPGLDGWHLLVTVIEGIRRKELPYKFKTIVSNIGMILLMAFSVAIIVKDVITLFIK